MQLHSLSASCGLRARLGRWLRGSAAPGRAQIRVCRRFRLHQPGSHGPQSSLQLGSTATPKSGVVNWLGRVERAWAVMRRWPHLPARPLSFTPTSSSSSCNGGVTPSCIGTRARRRRAEEVGAAPSLTSHAGADGHLVLVESAMGFAVSGSWWRRRWGGAPPAGRPWSTPPLPCRWRRWHPPSLPWISSGGHGWGDPATTVAAARALWPATGSRPRARRGEGRPLVARARAW
jgi:hypothetical protein